MELKCIVLLSVLGMAAFFTIQSAENNEEQGESAGDLQSSFSSPISSDQQSDSSSNIRDKRGLLFKKLKKHSGGDTYVVNRRYEGSTGYEYRPNREVHHHHHYSYQQAPVVEQTYQPYPAPSNDYHHYHGAYESGGFGYYSGGYAAAGSSGYSRPNYGNNGGYAQYPQQQAPISASPLGSGHNNVDRGQGAAAVNNIAIIHARAGSSNNLVESESSGALPQPLPAGVADALHNIMGD